MPSFDVDFEVWCSCGEGLCNQSEVKAPRGYKSGNHVTVEPCEKCIQTAKDEGFDEGHTTGYDLRVEEEPHVHRSPDKDED